MNGELQRLESKHSAWEEIVSAMPTAFFQGAVAIGESCVAVVHYGGCFEGMAECSFGMPRDRYEKAVPAIEAAAEDAGLLFEGYVQACGKTYARPFVRVGRETDEGTAWVNVYPLDAIPSQVTLRFRVFRQAAKMMALFRSMEDSGDYSRMADFDAMRMGVRRFEGLQTGLLSCLCCHATGKRMGERTVYQRTIVAADLLPPRMMPFGATLVPVALKVSNWTLEPTEERLRAVGIIQKESLESLQAVDEVCSKLQIDYFLVGGSMLGALRHKGFIPWDDDTDVGMLRKDYKRFCREAEPALGERYFVQLPSTDRHNHFVYARLRKAGIEYITHYNEDKDFHKGIWVDLFPFDARPRSEALAKVQRLLANGFARASMGFKRRREYAIADMRMDGSGLPAGDRRYLRFYRVASAFFPVRLCCLAYHCAARFFNPFLYGRENAVYASFIPSYTTIAQSEVRPLRKVEYEGALLPVPHGAEAFLERQYGDYEIMPPEHERYAEHGFKYLRGANGEIIGA